MRYFLTTLLASCLFVPNLMAQEETTETDTAPVIDALDLANGALVLSSSSEYDQGVWSALSLIDGITKTGWASKRNAVNDNEIVIELPTPTLIRQFVLDTNGIDGVGRGARNFTLLAQPSHLLQDMSS